jgi:hypothetical protein
MATALHPTRADIELDAKQKFRFALSSEIMMVLTNGFVS